MSEPPAWPSGIADDHTPIEYSVAFNESEPDRLTLRILGEALDTVPSATTNMSAARRFIQAQAGRFGLAVSRFDQVNELFATDDPRGDFGLWHSMVFRPGRRPEFKVYFNPEVKGVHRAPGLVAEALRRLGLEKSYDTALEYAIRPGELGRDDRLTFFAVDLHDQPHARVKLYLSHYNAQARDVVRAARAVAGIEADEIAEFCALAGGGTVTFAGRPLVGSYTFLSGQDRPVGYSVYVPIRSYVRDDEQAYRRVTGLLERYGFDSGQLDRAIDAVARRPLRDGVGLIAHVSLRLGPPRPGVTVYLSAEAYRVDPPRPLLPSLAGEHPELRMAAVRPDPTIARSE
ncbi:prenyltransferase [Rugosimonospora africana]|uniref:Prenyltransferase n=1 Tax=Rugosimonospora africana TaxID=556532 RepID=A0A8J3R266_9ACTN|nr:prenyltransferase [Rugosimonospora africana]